MTLPVPQTVPVTMPDGVGLATDVWLPAGQGPWPTLLQRLPYGRGSASAMVLPSPAALTRLGYAVVVQDVRGTGDSEGTFVPFANASDGVVAVEWAAAQPFSTGSVVMYGFSYQGYHQLQVAAQRPTGLVGIAPMMAPTSPYEFVYENGLRKWDFMTLWGAQLARLGGDTSGRHGDIHAAGIDAIGAEPPTWWADWISHDRFDDYWADLTADLSAIEVPAFTVAGYADVFAGGTWDLITALSDSGVRSVIGPWEHMPWGSVFGDLDLGEQAGPHRALDAFLAFLSDVFAGTDAGPSHTWFTLGAAQPWQTSTVWPPATATLSLHGASGTRGANSSFGDGRLVATRAQAGGVSDVTIADPSAVVPGTSAAYPLTTSAAQRRDVLCYTAEPASEGLHIVGTPTLQLTVETPLDSLDIVAALCVVTGGESHSCGIGGESHSCGIGGESHSSGIGGESRQIAMGGLRLIPGQGPTMLTVDLSPIAVQVAPGEQLRVELSTSRFPRYDINPHVTGSAESAGSAGPASAAGPAHPARIGPVAVSALSLHLPTAPEGIA